MDTVRPGEAVHQGRGSHVRDALTLARRADAARRQVHRERPGRALLAFAYARIPSLIDESTRVRRAQAADISALEHIIRNVGLFTPDEADGFAATLVEHFEAQDSDEPIWLISEPGGAAYLAPGQTPDEWNLLFLGVLPEARRAGLGRDLVVAAERASRRCGASSLQIDTSDAPNLGAARALYAELGYLEIAVVPDHWGPGDAMVSYRKAL